MKIFLGVALILFCNYLYAEDNNVWICSNELHMEFLDTSAVNERGVWIYSSAIRSNLNFTIQSIDSIYVTSIKYRDKDIINECDRKDIQIEGRFYIKFNKPFNGGGLIADVPAPSSKFIINGKRYYLLAVTKRIERRKYIYYRVFTFNLSDPHG